MNARTTTCLALLRSQRAALESADPSLPKLSAQPLKIVTANNFPTAAGLASSAAGFAALVFAIATLYALPASPTELSRIARQGSGSACRSLFGGYVAWESGSAGDGSDSVAVEVAPRSAWPAVRALILVASAEKKGVSSTSGMQATVATSSLFAARAGSIVPARMEAMKRAVAARDFAAFAELTMRDSNSFHACCADTYPPIFYMNDVSRAAVRCVEAINALAGEGAAPVAAYTFDAGPNCVVYYLEENEAKVAGFFKQVLDGRTAGWEGERGVNVGIADEAKALEQDESLKVAVESVRSGISRVILTEVGEGPMVVGNHLIDEKGEAVLG